MKRLIIRLPNLAILPNPAPGCWLLSSIYYSTVQAVFEKAGLQPNDALGKQVAALIQSVVSGVSAQTGTTITLRFVFEQHETDLLQLYSRATGCLRLKDINFFNTFYAWLDDATADLLRKKLVDMGVSATESTPQSFRVDTTPHSILPVLPPTYLTQLAINQVWAMPGGNGQYAKCVLTEYSFRKDRSGQPELALPTTVSTTPTDDRRTQAQWDRIRNQATPALQSTDAHSDHTLSVLTASHTYPLYPSSDRFRGIVPNVTLQQLVSVYQLVPNLNIPGRAPYHPEIALLKAILWAEQGAILLIEYELNDHKPLETDYLTFWLMYLASACFGITVVEPAGNGTLNIDTPSLYDSALVSGGVCLDSGAILVGAADATNQTLFNFTIRQTNRFVYAPVPVNVFPVFRGNIYESFDGTSAASAIIAGIACQIQSVYFARYGRYLRPSELRTHLCNSTTSSQVVRPAGYVPDVAKIVASF